MKQQLVVKLAVECVHVGPELEVFQPHTDHRPVLVDITTNIKWAPKPKAKKVAWDLKRVEGDPKSSKGATRSRAKGTPRPP